MNFKEIHKVELHCHLDCAFRVSTMFEISKKLKLDLPEDFEAFKDKVLLTRREPDLKTALSKFLIIQKCFKSEDFIQRLAFEYIEDAYNKGVRVLELRYSPSFIWSGNKDISFEKIHDLILSGIAKALEKYNIKVGVIGIIGRADPLPLASKVCDFILKNKDTFCGIDLADNEKDFDCKLFQKFFNRAYDQGMNITIHAGEAIYEGSSKSVIDAILLLKASRIGHGIQIINDKRAVDTVIENDVLLEVCPTSNYLTSSVASFEEHPISKLMDLGVKVSINSDDPGVFDCPIDHEYKVLSEHLGFSKKEFDKCNQDAFNKSFIPKSELKEFEPLFFTKQ